MKNYISMSQAYVFSADPVLERSCVDDINLAT